MACFVVPAVEAVVVTASYFAIRKKEMKIEMPKHSANGISLASENSSKIKLSRKVSWLMAMLWGGVLLLAFEHFWHGEIVPFPPFLTAMSNLEDKAEMLHEMATVGVSMAVFVTAVWGMVCAAASALYRKALKTVSSED